MTRQLLQHQAAVADLARQRREVIVELLAAGLSKRQVAGVLGVSFSRVVQIEEDARATHPAS